MVSPATKQARKSGKSGSGENAAAAMNTQINAPGSITQLKRPRKEDGDEEKLLKKTRILAARKRESMIDRCIHRRRPSQKKF